MSWNSTLYYFHLEAGGQFFGVIKEREPYAVLLLPDPKGDLLIRPRLRSSNQYNVFWDAEVSTRVTLERPYTLRVKPESAVQEGLHTVLGGLDRGAQVLGIKTGFSPDYGVPKLTAHRSIKTNEQNFTKWVFQNQTMCAILEEKADFGLKVGPMTPHSREHLVCARTDIEKLLVDDWGDGWGMEPESPEFSQDGGRSRPEVSLQELNRLLDLCRAARDAVTTWPMPMQPG